MPNDLYVAAMRLVAETSLRALLLVALVGGVLLAARVRSGATRHAAWTAVLLAMMFMPVLPSIVPAIPVPMGTPFVSDGAPAVPFETPDMPAMERPTAERGATLPQAPEAAAGVALPTAPAAPPIARTPVWPSVALAVYALGACVLLSRLLVGWFALARIIRRSRRVEDGRDRTSRVYESSLVATPVTAGVFRPAIILPAAWRRWPDETRRAVLAHELAHVGRRDPLVILLAHVNRAVFWFNPLAWWLERTIAAAAEDACDEAAVRTVGERRQYAEVLLDMAEAVARAGRRLSWQGVGVDGTGLLGRRIDRLLRGDTFREVSMTRKAIVGVGCTAAIILVVACRPQPPAAPPLQPDPEVAARIARQDANTKFYKAAEEMTAGQAAELEAALKQNPEDRDARRKLATFYRSSGPKTVGWNETVAARRRHILWLIEHHPGDEMTLRWGAINPAYDPAGYAAATKLWLAQTAKKDVDVNVLSNAAYFFEGRDKPLAEQLLLRAQAIDPGGPQPRIKDDTYRFSWSERLGRLYASGIVGAVGSELGIPSVNPDEARGAYAQEARRKLEASKEANVLLAAGEYLMRPSGRFRGKLDFDPAPLGRSYVQRAAQLDPTLAPRVQALLVQERSNERNRAVIEKLKGVPADQEPAVVAAEPEGTRIGVLPMRTQMEYMRAESLEYTKGDKAAASATWERARKYAADLLNLAEQLPNDPNRGTALFAAHTTLGSLALHDGDKAAALRHMEAAVKAPASEELQYGHDMLWMRLAVGMLKRGEYEAVAQFLDGYARLNATQRDWLTKAADATRAGRMPEWYQYQMTRK